MTRRSKN